MQLFGFIKYLETLELKDRDSINQKPCLSHAI